MSSFNSKQKQNKKNKQSQRPHRKIQLKETIVVRGPLRRKAKRRSGNKTGPVRGLNYMATDGINSSRVVTNTSVVEDRFQMRREKIANISGTAAFTLAQQLYINPGNSTLFPIFSQIASTYEQYRVNHLRFTFETDAYTATNGTASAGKVILATNFDPDDANFSGDTQMENYWHSVKGPPYAPIISHDVVQGARGSSSMREAALKNYYVYSSSNSLAPVTGEGKFYDFGNFQLATSGNAVTTEIGELYVEYSFTMIHPKQPEFPIGGSAVHLQNIADNGTAASPLGLTPFTSFSVQPGSTLSTVNMAGSLASYTSSTVGLNDSLDTTVNLPNVSATWLVHIQWGGANSIAAVPTMTAAGGATALTPFAGGTGGGGFFLAAGTSATQTKVFTTTATATPVSTSNSIAIGGLTGMTDALIDIYIVRLPSALVTALAPSSPVLIDLQRELRLLRQEFQNSRLKCDSDFDDDECKEIEKSSTKDLSRSTVSLISEIVSRAGSNKK